MILALSRFKVVSDMALEVRVAFQERPHLVDDVPGFLGMEVFTDDKQDSDFYLVTRWTDPESYTAWHASPAHHKSHSGIPKGLKLDPSFTQISILQRIPPTNRRDNLERVVADAAPLITSYLGNASAAHFLLCEADGAIEACSTACAAALKVEAADALIGANYRAPWKLPYSTRS
jgi:heme-degrading monooxygenase HmoA